MFHTSFDDLESSLISLLALIRKKQLLEQSSRVKLRESELRQTQLREQLERQAALLSRIKNHYPELRSDTQWLAIEPQIKELLARRTLFGREEEEQFSHLSANVHQLITQKQAQIDRLVNERIVERGVEKAARSKQVKIYRNWTSV